MKTIKSNKSYMIDLEDLVSDELEKKCKKNKKKKKKNKSSKNKKSSDKKGKKKNKKEIGADFFYMSKKQVKQADENYEELTREKSFIDKILSAVNLDAKIKVHITDESLANALVVAGTIVTSIITRNKLT